MSLCLIAFVPSLAGCLEHFRLKADVDLDTQVEGEETEVDKTAAESDPSSSEDTGTL